MKPALSPQTTGFLPSRSTSAVTSSSTCGSVTTVRMISTRFCTGAGLKKCTPMTRPGWALAVEISVTLSEEVLVARIASGATMPSSSWKICLLDLERLHDRLDHEVGLVQVLERGAERDPAQQLGRLGLGELLALDRAGGRVLEVLAPAGHRLVVQLDADDGEPVAGEHLGDAGTHGAEADHADGRERAGLRTPAQSCARSLVDRLVGVHLSATSITTRTPLTSRPSSRSLSRSRRSYGARSARPR